MFNFATKSLSFPRMAGLATVLLLGACSSLPGAGPLSSELSQKATVGKDGKFGYEIIDVNDSNMSTILAYQPKSFGASFGDRPWKPKSTIGVGDVVSVVVWETGEAGLFSRGVSGKSELGPFQIEQSGKIPIPYVGYVRAKGRTVAQLRWAIESQLKDKAVDPQVVVSIKENNSGRIAVNGAVQKPGRYPISLSGDQISDVVAKAGGTKADASETTLTLVRGKTKGKQLLQQIFENQSENVYLRPGDQLYLAHDPQTFTAFGAVEKVGEYPVKALDVSLVEALGRVGGLSDSRANARALYVFRYESPELLATLGRKNAAQTNAKVPVIYRLNMRDGRSYFFGQSFIIRDKDVLYVANSYGSELQKFVNILSGITTPAITTSLAFK